MGSVSLYCGDALDVLSTMESKSTDVVLTDMPYGVGIDYTVYEDTPEHLDELIRLGLPEMKRVARRVALTCGVANVHKYPAPTWILCWACSGAGSSGKWGFSTWQPILVYGEDPYLANGLGRRPDLIYCNAKDEKLEHPCPKPLEVWVKILERVSLPGEMVIDPFMGSGTTGIACVQAGRHFAGIEIDPDYFEIAQKRIEQVQAQPRLFDERCEVEQMVLA